MLLEKAKELGGKNSELIVVIARDTSVIKQRGHPPVYNENQRLALIRALKAVDIALLGNEDPDRLKIVMDEKPGAIVLGYDQDIDIEELRNTLEKRGLKNFQVHRLDKYGDPGYNSSSLIREKILRNQNPKE